MRRRKKPNPILTLIVIAALAIFGWTKYHWDVGSAEQKTSPSCAAECKADASCSTIVGTVTKVSDGDTIWVMAHGNRVKVRMDRIDAPESNQPYGKESRQFLADRIMGKEVEVRYEKTDRYGRVLGIVYLGTNDVNLAMVSNGMAWHYSHYDKTPAYAQAQAEAKEAKRGLWADPNPINPYIWRKRK